MCVPVEPARRLMVIHLPAALPLDLSRILAGVATQPLRRAAVLAPPGAGASSSYVVISVPIVSRSLRLPPNGGSAPNPAVPAVCGWQLPICSSLQPALVSTSSYMHSRPPFTHTLPAISSVNHIKLAEHPSFKCFGGRGSQNIKNQLIVLQFGSSPLVSRVKPMERCAMVLLVSGQYGGSRAWEGKRLHGARQMIERWGRHSVPRGRSPALDVRHSPFIYHLIVFLFNNI